MSRDRTQRNTILILLLLSLLYFVLFIPPNNAASENLEMVSVFEPDEAVPLPYVLNMIRPADNLKNALIQFAFYKYYFYGFPHFAYSAVLLLLLRWQSLLENTSLVMVTLRQMVSLLPLLAAIWVLVYLQTRFKGYRAILLFVFLVSLPVVFRNNFWWHPDGLAILFAILAIFFLERDDLRFGKNFYFAAAMCGISAGTKGIGFYFFLTIIVYLILGYFVKKISIRKLFILAFGFLVGMLAAYWLVNPTLVYSSIRERYFQVMLSQSRLLSQGYEVLYPKGLLSILPEILKDYAILPFLLLVFGACIWGLLYGQKRLLFTILFTWTIPITISILFFIHYKFQYWLPVALPLFSTFAILLPEKLDIHEIVSGRDIRKWIPLLVLLFFSTQLSINIVKDVNLYTERLYREQNSSDIQFYDRVKNILSPLPENRTYHVYYDVRMYVPARTDWYCESIFEMLNYAYLKEKTFDVILLRQQRIYDYLNPRVVGLNADNLSASQTLYKDAQSGEITDYQLLYRDEYGLIFVRERLYQNHFSK